MGIDLGQAVSNIAGPIASVFAPPLAQYIGQGQTNQANWDATQAANAQSQASVQQQEDFQTKAAQTAMDYDSAMSNTAHQREVTDLQKAGLNPLLSANAGASTPTAPSPSGSSYTAQAAPYTSPIQPAANSTIQTAQAISSLVGSLSEASLTSAKRDKLAADTANATASAGLSTSETKAMAPASNFMDNLNENLVKPVMLMWQKSMSNAGSPISSERQQYNDNQKQIQNYENMTHGGMR